MSAERDKLLDELVAAAGDQAVRALFAKASDDKLRAAIRDYREVSANIRRYGRLGAMMRDESQAGAPRIVKG